MANPPIERVCIIDDDPILIFATKRILQNARLGDTVLVYNNGKEAYEGLCALRSAGEPLPELILLDLNMPIWDGWQFLDEFTQTPFWRETTIFVVTSSNHPDDRLRAEAYPAVRRFLLKPLTIRSLTEAIAPQP